MNDIIEMEEDDGRQREDTERQMEEVERLIRALSELPLEEKLEYEKWSKALDEKFKEIFKQ